MLDVIFSHEFCLTDKVVLILRLNANVNLADGVMVQCQDCQCEYSDLIDPDRGITFILLLEYLVINHCIGSSTNRKRCNISS